MDTPKNVSFEVMVTPEMGHRSVFDEDVFPTVETLDMFRSPQGKIVEVARKLQKNGIQVHKTSDFSISAESTSKKFEAFFGTKITAHEPPKGSSPENSEAPRETTYFSPAKGAPWELPKKDGLDNLIDGAYIQHDPIYLSGERESPPLWSDKFRLRVPVDVAQFMRASAVHRKGVTGKGVRVAMPDTGFYHHPYYVKQGYNFLAITAPDVSDHTSDSNGHGTGECANLFATAPGINFMGVKMGNPTLGFKTAVDLRPHVITCSWGYSRDLPGTSMPNWLKPLHLTVLDAVAKGIVVCFSAGNGHFAFPGSMPEVISIGGVFVNEELKYSATQYASGFDSTWFPGRRTPDFCGLVGTPPTADYIVLPVQIASRLEKERGWGAFSGTSAAAPMVAGVCALLFQADSSLTPAQVKNLLAYTARDITTGRNAQNKAARPGPDGATGYGLADAERALDALL